MPIARFKLADSKSQRHDLMVGALEAVGLRPDETLGRYPHQLSGGQRQRIIVARALMLRPKVIIADEPVSMVDASLRATILESLRKVNQALKVPILYITHDLGTAYHVADHILVMYRGNVVEAGDVATVINNPKHPYTRLLIDSIPWPDPKRKWGQEVMERNHEVHVPPKHPGCRFAARCPAVMDKCLVEQPPLYLTDHSHAAACYVYDEMTAGPQGPVELAAPVGQDAGVRRRRGPGRLTTRREEPGPASRRRALPVAAGPFVDVAGRFGQSRISRPSRAD